MDENLPHLNNEAFVQGSNGLNSILTPIPNIGEYSHLGLEQSFEFTYDQLWINRPITR